MNRRRFRPFDRWELSDYVGAAVLVAGLVFAAYVGVAST
jgi:hypothetical protein